MSTALEITIVLFAIALLGIVLGVPIALGGRRTPARPQAQDIATPKNAQRREAGSAPVVAAHHNSEIADLRADPPNASRTMSL